MANSYESAGRVVCCRGEYDATRHNSSGSCLSGDQGGVGKTFSEAQAICAQEGWRLCRKEEFVGHPNASGSCSTGCGIELEKVWVEFDRTAAHTSASETPTSTTAKSTSSPRTTTYICVCVCAVCVCVRVCVCVCVCGVCACVSINGVCVCALLCHERVFVWVQGVDRPHAECEVPRKPL